MMRPVRTHIGRFRPGKEEKISLPIICLTFVMILAGTASYGATGQLDTTFTVLIQKNKSAIEYFRKSHQDLLLEKNKLLHSISFNGSPTFGIVSQNGAPPFFSFDGARQRMVPGVAADMQLYEWSLWLNAHSPNSGEGSGSGVMIPFLSSRYKTIRNLDTLIALEKIKGYYQVESIFLQDLKGICDLVISIRMAREEIHIRGDLSRQIDSIGDFTNKFNESGQIDKRSSNQLALASLDNSLQTAACAKRITLLTAELQNRFFVDSGNMNGILNECASIVFDTSRMMGITPFRNRISTTSECIDSLNEKMLAIRRSVAGTTDYSFKIGPQFDIPGDGRSITLGAVAQFSLSFLARKALSFDEFSFPSHADLRFCPDTVRGPDSGYVHDSEIYIERCQAEIASIIDELKSGRYYSLPWINDLFSRILNSRITVMQLTYSYMRYKISIVQSLDALGLRSDLQARYFGGK